jgi:ubiquinone/menaquinone biosynthesis C-methylase UbiE
MLAKSKARTVSLRDRCLQPEMMDQPDLDSARHKQALNGLRRVNSLSFSSRAYWPFIRSRAEQVADRPVRVLDLACGGGDVGLALAKHARRKNLDIELTGWDISPLAVSTAADRAKAAGFGNTHFADADVLEDELPSDFDIVMCSLFLHHLEEAETVALLARMAAATRGDVLVNDFRRTRAGYCLAWIGCRMLSRSHIVHDDGLASVAGAYTIGAATRLVSAAGLDSATITPFWPERYLISWSSS